MTISRRQAREWTIQMLTAAELNPPADRAEFFAQFWAEVDTIDESEGGVGKIKGNKSMKKFAEDNFAGVMEKQREIDAILEKRLSEAEWELWRLGTVERAVLRLGVYELKFAGTPAPVAINEAVDLVNWFSNPKSRLLVNGILDKVKSEE